jgi:predicted metal-dependent hydrolase
MMKQLDFFFDFFTQSRTPRLNKNEKTLVYGGKKEPQEVLFVHGRKVRVRRKSYQRTLSLSMKPNGEIVVVAARSIPLKMITRFVMDSWPWVLEQMEKMSELRSRFPQKKYEVGEYFPVMGLQYSLKVEPTKNRRHVVRLESGNLIVELPEKMATVQKDSFLGLRSIVYNYYEELGKRVLAERVFINSQKLQLYPQSITYRNQKTRWGSCSPNGNISLNWRLVAAPLEVIDYVIIHELCHLEHHNHSKSFWKLVEKHSPRWKKIRHWLHENQYSFDFLSERSELHP